MKVQIRRNIFETNSSSVHSITICKSEDYNAFQAGTVWCKESYSDNSKFLPEAEAIEKNIDILKKNGLDDEKYFDAYRKKKKFWDAFESVYGDDYDEYQNLKDNYDLESRYEYYLDWDSFWEDCEYETFEEEYITEHGDKVIAWGYYGSDY